MKKLQEWADRYQRKLIESGYEDVTARVEDDVVILEFFSENPEYAKRTLLLKKNYDIQLLYHISSIGSRWIAKIKVDESFQAPITDNDRLNNKIFQSHLSFSYDHHATRFVDNVKRFYDIDMTLEEFDKMNALESSKMKLQPVYRINGTVQVAKIVLKEKIVYVIHGQTSERGIPKYKTALPDIYNVKTLLPVPDKVLYSGIDRLAFTKLVHDTMAEKRLHFKKLFKDLENKSDKELFLSGEFSSQEKRFVKKLRSIKPEEYGLTNAIEDICEKYGRTRVFSGTREEKQSDS